MTPVPTPRSAFFGRRRRRALASRGRCEDDRHAFDAVDEVRPQPGWWSSQLNVREPPEQLLEHHSDFLARKARTEAEVFAEPERQVFVGRAADVEAVRLGKDVLVAIGRWIPHQHMLAGADRCAANV